MLHLENRNDELLVVNDLFGDKLICESVLIRVSKSEVFANV